MNIKFPKAILVVLDGFGIASPSAYNAISIADPAFFQSLIAWYPTRVLQASGPAVGLPWGERGNSEVGHVHLGSGRVVTQELPRINRSIADGSFFKNPVLLSAITETIKNKKTLHIAGLLGVGSVHSYEQHLYTLIGMCKDLGVTDLAIHIFTDGVDSPAKTSLGLIQKLDSKLKAEKFGRIATITGRFYAMDKGDHWDLTQAALNAMVMGDGEAFSTPEEAVTERYSKGISDDMIPPSVINGGEVSKISAGDSIIFFNFRSDRMMQITKQFTEQVKNVRVVTLSLYSPDLKVDVAFMPVAIKDGLAEVISNAGFTQSHFAESDKFAHVTFFFNGHSFEPWKGEERFIIKSTEASFKTYDERPEMSAKEIVKSVTERAQSKDDKLMVINFANCDLVGHTGNLHAAVEAVKVVDECLKELAELAKRTSALLVITADHGNCEQMRDAATGRVDKEHTSNPVPVVFFGEGLKLASPSGLNLVSIAGLVPSGILADVAPTILKLLGMEVPAAMTGDVIDVDV